MLVSLENGLGVFWLSTSVVRSASSSSVPLVRFPLFWLSLHNLPQRLYHWLVRRTLHHDGYFVTYFHPWEFFELNDHPEFNIPYIIRHNSGRKMQQRLDSLIKMLKEEGEEFVTFREFILKAVYKE